MFCIIIDSISEKEKDRPHSLDKEGMTTSVLIKGAATSLLLMEGWPSLIPLMLCH